MILSFRLLLLVLILFVLSFKSLKADDYKVGILNFPPYSIIKENNELQGSLYILLKKVLDNTGIKYSTQGFPPSRLYNNLKTGKTHIWLGLKGVKEYDDMVLYSKVSPKTLDVRVYTNERANPLKSIDGLKGKKVIIIRGYHYGGFIKFLKDPANQIKLHPTNDHIQAFKMLLAHRANYLVDYREPAKWTLRSGSLPQKDISNVSIKKSKIFFIVSKKTPDAKNLMKKIERSYRKLKKENRNWESFLKRLDSQFKAEKIRIYNDFATFTH
jgi:polar amino acid transport system substrate-binding protein